MRQLLKENFQNKQLLKPPFFTQLMGRLSEEQLSYHDSLKIMIQAQKLQQPFYAFPLTVEAPLIPKRVFLFMNQQLQKNSLTNLIIIRLFCQNSMNYLHILKIQNWIIL